MDLLHLAGAIMKNTFSSAIAKLTGKIRAKEEAFIREFLTDLSVDLIHATPVDTGRMISAWWPSVDVPMEGPEVMMSGADKSGAPSIARVMAVTPTIAVGQSYFITNSQPYRVYVNMGTARFPPRMFTNRTATRASILASAAAAKVRKK